MTSKLWTKTLIGAVIATAVPLFGAPPASAQEQVTISHFFSGDTRRAALKEIFDKFKGETGIEVVDSPIGHEDFKTAILVRAAGNSLPDVFSYWAGARVQFVVDAGAVAPLDDLWASAQLGDVVAKSIANGATLYNGKRYFVPFGYHVDGFYYNPKVMTDSGITTMPKTWDELLAACQTLKSKGIPLIAMGSKNRWPAQGYFDFFLMRTAGPDYRLKLMTGKASYTDSEVKRAMGLWRDLIDGGCFVPNSNARGWRPAADLVVRGEAAMTLLGTYAIGYFVGNGLKPGVDFDVLDFPTIDKDAPSSAVGNVDGFVVAANAEHPVAARKLVAWLAKDSESQAKWIEVNGALSADPQLDNAPYSKVHQKAYNAVNQASTYRFSYDLETPPPVAEVGLNMFQKFMDDPSDIDGLLAETQEAAADAFKE